MTPIYANLVLSIVDIPLQIKIELPINYCSVIEFDLFDSYSDFDKFLFWKNDLKSFLNFFYFMLVYSWLTFFFFF